MQVPQPGDRTVVKAALIQSLVASCLIAPRANFMCRDANVRSIHTYIHTIFFYLLPSLYNLLHRILDSTWQIINSKRSIFYMCILLVYMTNISYNRMVLCHQRPWFN